jgi:DNA-directed RNA polymerase subunit N (RpoN/RPB10)
VIRRFPGRCYFCGDPVVVGAQFCIAHLWAQGIESVPAVKVTRKVLDALSTLRPEKR